jgi:hypothetical protein
VLNKEKGRIVEDDRKREGKLMKTPFVFVCCLAAVAVVQADPNDPNIPRAKAVQSVQVQPQAPAKINHNTVGRRFYGQRYLSHDNALARPNAVVTGNVSGNAQAQDQRWRRYNLNTSPNPHISSARFVQNNRITGSERWQGQNYAAFRSYQPQWHNRNWWHQHHDRIVLIGGGYYYWDAGFWYPAWGYDPVYSYYPYDGPIYAYNDLPPDQVIANVQASLQAQGYYEGEIDGLLGPLTRAALADYQRDHGLYTTAAIDQPTLASLGMG